MVSFTDHYNAISIFLLTDSPQKLWVLLSYKDFLFFIKNTKNAHSLASDWWEYTKYGFKENANVLSENSTTQENITISRKWNLDEIIKFWKQ